MSCQVCRQSKLLPPRSEEDCLEAALERVRNHVLFFKNSANEAEQRFQQLQKRNEQLTHAVQLLQQQQTEQLRTKSSGAEGQSPPPKRRSKTSPTTPDFSEDDEKAASQSQLNMALNSQQLKLLDSSALSVSPGAAGAVVNHSDSIAETERPKESPRKLQTQAKKWQRRQSTAENSRNGNENRNPLIRSASTTSWLSKNSASPTATVSAFADRNSEWASKFIKPQATTTKAKNLLSAKEVGPPPPVKKTASLSLSKRSNTGCKKMQQTRLQLDVAPKERSFSGSESTFCEDVIEASPNTNASITKSKTKVARSWLLRTGNSSANASRSHQNAQLVTLTNDSNDEDDDDFDVCYPQRNTTEYIPKHKPGSSKDLNADAEMEFELRPDDVAANATSESLLKPIDSSSSSSVMLLTPATQDIIFLDDTTCVEDGMNDDDTTQIESMDLLDGLMRTDDAANLERLKQIESERIKKLQLQAANKAHVTTKTESTKKLTKEKIKAPLKIKQENVSLALPTSLALPKAPAATATSNDMDYSTSDELDDCMPRPMLVKKEPASPPPQRSFERFNINCNDCRNYVKFFGDTMSDADIEAHLNKCRSHNVRPTTPEGFWNPLMLSFAPDDPRNEVLIDNRFVGKKRST